jgi:hypothetical protein
VRRFRSLNNTGNLYGSNTIYLGKRGKVFGGVLMKDSKTG